MWRDDQFARTRIDDLEREAAHRRRIHGDALRPERRSRFGPRRAIAQVALLTARLAVGLAGSLDASVKVIDRPAAGEPRIEPRTPDVPLARPIRRDCT